MLPKRKKGSNIVRKPKKETREFMAETLGMWIKDPSKYASFGIDPIMGQDSHDLETSKKLMELYSGKSLSGFLTENPMPPDQATESYRFEILDVRTPEKKLYERRKLRYKLRAGTHGATKK